MFWRALKWGRRAPDCFISAVEREWVAKLIEGEASVSVNHSSPLRMVPRASGTKPARASRKVVLPAPLGPTMAHKCLEEKTCLR